MTPREALEKAIRVLGSQTAVAAAAGEGIETGHVYHWLNKAPEVPAKHCPGIERATRDKGEAVFCEQLCPSTDWAAVRTQAGPKQTKRKADRATACLSQEEADIARSARMAAQRAIDAKRPRDGSSNNREGH